MWLRIWALTLRHLFLLKHSPTRLMGIFFWPMMSLFLWGFVTTYLRQMNLPSAALFMLGAFILWDVLYRGQQAVTLSITEEYWVRNIINIFVAPVRGFELVVAACIVGLLKGIITTVVLAVTAEVAYSFNLLAVGWPLAPFFGTLVLFGWAMGLMTMGLVLRFGYAAEALIWGIPFLMEPLSAVFYPVSVLPWWLQLVSFMLPSTYVFEGLRATLAGGRPDTTMLAMAMGLNLVYFIAGGVMFSYMLRVVRRKGYLSHQAME